MAVMINDRHLAEAARWQIRLAEADDANLQEQFAAWLEEHESHRAAFDAIGTGYHALASVADTEEINDLVVGAYDNIERSKTRRRRTRTALSAFLVLGVMVGAVLALRELIMPSTGASGPQLATVYSSDPSQVREFDLPDGSRLTLSGGSIVKVSYSDDERGLQLVKGQARFQVAHSEGRPFRVRAGDGVVTATGTDFSVTYMLQYSNVTLVEGRVRMDRSCAAESSGCKSASLSLTPGDRVEWQSGQTEIRRSRVSSQEALAWLSGRLIAREMPLGLVAEYLNSQSSRPGLITVAPSAAGTPVSGVFNLDDPDGFVQAAQQLLPISVRRDRDGYEIR